MRKQLSLEVTHHKRLKRLADASGLGIQQAGTTILEFILPKFESGELSLVQPSVAAANQGEPDETKGERGAGI